MPTKEDLLMLKALPLELKISKSLQRIREFVSYYGLDSVVVAYSGGVDSVVLLDLCRIAYPDIKAVFCDTGLEYPEIRDFVLSQNIEIIKPKMQFRQAQMV